jgi:pimeloyl-ACP methyl ester carboxylesterase
VTVLEKITISPDLTFDALVAGEPGAPLVLLLHGFAESMHCWRAQLTALSDMGYRAIALSQLAIRQVRGLIRAMFRIITWTG